MEGGDEDAVQSAATGDPKSVKKQLSIQFKAQHALVVAFFLLIL